MYILEENNLQCIYRRNNLLCIYIEEINFNVYIGVYIYIEEIYIY